jgi:predicted amidophosphoribosyltransferase
MHVYFDCSWFAKCPICDRCMRAAPNLYSRCRNCGYGKVRVCKHTEEQRAFAIRRANHKLTLTHDLKAKLKETNDGEEKG